MSRRPPGEPLKGRTIPRVYPKPLRKLTPKTTHGYAVVAFARALGVRLYPWQEWALIHALELLPDGTYRFRVVVILVARQNGKTTLLKVLALWRMMQAAKTVVVGTSTTMEYAREAWQATVDLAADRDRQKARITAWCRFVDYPPDDDKELIPYLAPADRMVRWQKAYEPAKYGALDTSLVTTNGSRYKIATAGRRGGRSLSVDLGIADELREHRPQGSNETGWEAWAALDGATTARPMSQLWALSNMGDDSSVVLNQLRQMGTDYAETGEGDETLCLLDWSAPEDADVWDRSAWAQANPSLGYGGITEATLASKARLPAHVFKPEHMCVGVPTQRVAVPVAAWNSCEDVNATMERLRSRVACVVDVSPDLDHVALIACAVDAAGIVRSDVIGKWSSTDEAFRDQDGIPSLLRKVRPKVVGWFPDGPAGAMAPEMKAIGRRWVVKEIRGVEAGQACQGLAELVKSGRIRHTGDPMLTNHVTGANKQMTGDGWRFVRRGVGHVNAAYALAGAAHLARLMPRSKRSGIVTADAPAA